MAETAQVTLLLILKANQPSYRLIRMLLLPLQLVQHLLALFNFSRQTLNKRQTHPIHLNTSQRHLLLLLLIKMWELRSWIK